ncbi:MAG: hypothetical protein OQJ89_10775, partial [Kangiellaceae bacterium]|nr:hypothetical protein [Kangiellaceae bacterium]
MDSFIKKATLLIAFIGLSLTGYTAEGAEKRVLAKSNTNYNTELSQSLIRLSDQSTHQFQPNSKAKVI